MAIKVLTNVRADDYFLALWIAHYGAIVGRENLHVMLDGDDWEPKVDVTGVNLHVRTDIPRDRLMRLTFTARVQSRMANSFLNAGADVVLRTDIDELVTVDPRANLTLHEYLSLLPENSMCAALGLDVIQAPGETPLEAERPILQQRRHAILTREYCKLVAVKRPVRWIGGQHRGRDVPIDIAPELLLFHLALFDKERAEQRIAERSAILNHATQGAHITGRLTRFDEVADNEPLEFDAISSKARLMVMNSVGSKTGPHPGFIRDGQVERGYHVRLPERFGDLLAPPVASGLS